MYALHDGVRDCLRPGSAMGQTPQAGSEGNNGTTASPYDSSTTSYGATANSAAPPHRSLKAGHRLGRLGKAALGPAAKCWEQPTEQWEQRAEPLGAAQDSQVGSRGAGVLGRVCRPAEFGVRIQASPKAQAPGPRTNRRMERMFPPLRISRARLHRLRKKPASVQPARAVVSHPSTSPHTGGGSRLEHIEVSRSSTAGHGSTRPATAGLHSRTSVQRQKHIQQGTRNKAVRS